MRFHLRFLSDFPNQRDEVNAIYLSRGLCYLIFVSVECNNIIQFLPMFFVSRLSFIHLRVKNISY